MSYDDDRPIFVSALRPLGAALGDMILVGGWAHRLHSYHPLARAEASMLSTLDADLFVPSPSASTAVHVAALREAGFEIRLGGLDSAPVVEYVLIRPTHKYEFELEFLAHRRGGEYDRRGGRRTTTPVGEVVAQLLPFMDVMTHEPWTCILDETRGYPTAPTPLTLRVVSPAPYIAHKLMVLKDRSPAQKRYQDVRYLYETIKRFAPSLGELRASWFRRVFTDAERRRLAAGRTLLRSGTLIPSAARTPDLDGQTVDETHLRQVLELGLAQLFDPNPG